MSTAPLSEENTRARARLLGQLRPGDKLTVLYGLKKGRTATYRAPDRDNPWLLDVMIDGCRRVVRFDYVARAP